MKLRTGAVALLTALCCFSVWAQVATTPAAGLWELTSTVKTGFIKKSPILERKCLSIDAAAAFDQAFLGQPAEDGSSSATCLMSDLKTGRNSNSWKAQCAQRGVTLDGLGASTFTTSAYNGTQRLSTGTGDSTTTVIGRRLGPC